MSRFLCEALAKHHDRGAFQCGVPQLDEYLRERASQDMRRGVAAVFVVVPDDQPHRIVGYYTLSSASVVLADLPESISRRLPRYPALLAVLIGRLARDKGFPGTGRLLLLDALARSLRHSSEVAAALVLVDSKNAESQRFYDRYGFQQVLQTPNRMFLPMKTIERLFAEDHGKR